MKYLTSINKHNPKRAEQDGRYRHQRSNKTYSNTRAQKSNRATASTDRKVVAISDRIERKDARKAFNEMRRKRA
jgi:hypothetical protein